MITRHSLSVLRACMKLGVKRSFANKSFIVGSYIIYTILMVLYAGVVRMIPEADVAPFGLNHQTMIWYLGTSEMLVFMGSAWAFKELQNEITTEQVHAALIRPASYMLVRCGLWFGESLMRFVFLFPFYLLMMTLLGDGFILDPLTVLKIACVIPGATFMMICGSYFIGASCLWFIQSEPAYWIWEKSIFLFGAMVWPMLIYPAWLKVLCWLTPFPGILAIGGNMTLQPTVGEVTGAFLHQAVWVVIFFFVMRLYDRAVLNRVQSGEA